MNHMESLQQTDPFLQVLLELALFDSLHCFTFIHLYILEQYCYQLNRLVLSRAHTFAKAQHPP